MNETKLIKKSRKDHRCYQCGEFIPKGNSYKRHYGVYDGAFFDNCNHLECWDLWLIFNEDASEYDEWFQIYDDDMSHLQVPINFNEYKRQIREKYQIKEVIKKPSIDGLKEAQNILKEIYEKEPSDELMKTLSEGKE